MALWRLRGYQHLSIPAVSIESGSLFHIEQRGPNRDHYTLWGGSAALTAHAQIVETNMTASILG